MDTHPTTSRLSSQSIDLKGHFGFECVIFHGIEFALKHLLFFPPLHSFDPSTGTGLLTLFPALDAANLPVISLINTFCLFRSKLRFLLPHTVGSVEKPNAGKQTLPLTFICFLNVYQDVGISLRFPAFEFLSYLTVNVWLQRRNQEAARNWMLRRQEAVDWRDLWAFTVSAMRCRLERQTVVSLMGGCYSENHSESKWSEMKRNTLWMICIV